MRHRQWYGLVRKMGVAAGAVALFGVALYLAVPATFADGWNQSSKAPNTFSSVNSGISNTRHNLTMSYLGATSVSIMNQYRNNYVEVCVYCHTPHGANTRAAAPIWNRTVTPRTYTLYSSPTGLKPAPTQPGPNSLTCLSCHDGVTAIDSIINMPTKRTGAYAGWSAAQETTVGFAQLNKWGGGAGHSGFAAAGDPGAAQSGACLTCHNGGNAAIPDFQPFVIGGQFKNSVVKPDPADPTKLIYVEQNGDLSLGNYLADDHPIGVRYPDRFTRGVDYNEPTVRASRIAFFDTNGNGHADPNEVRLYDSGDGYEVECGSCHDPHGVRVSKSSNDLIPSFLRVGASVGVQNGGNSIVSANAGSQLCLTCHTK